MDDISVMEKPDWVSWDEIHELLLAAHKKNIQKGMVMKTALLSGEELKNRVGENGKCFIALSGEKLVGTTSVRIKNGNHWYDKNMKVAYSMLSAILPKFQGLGIHEDLNKLRDAFIKEQCVDAIEADTAEDNLVVRKKVKQNGYVEIAYVQYNPNHFSVIFVKWLHGCPFSDRKIRILFRLSKMLTRLRYDSKGNERNWFLSFIYRVVNRILL